MRILAAMFSLLILAGALPAGAWAGEVQTIEAIDDAAGRLDEAFETNLSEPAITLLGSEAAMRRFTAKLEGTYKGKPLTGTVYVTQIMVMGDGKWLERFYQVTQLKAAP